MTQSLTNVASPTLMSAGTTQYRRSQTMALATVSRWSLIIITTITAIASLQTKWSLASEFSWQCDEIPMFRRFTAAGAHVTNEAEAAGYKTSFYHARCGVMRSLRSPSSISAVHTTTGFWANLSTQLFGVSAFSARLVPMFWSMAAIAVAGFAGYWLTKRVMVGCVAAIIVSLSPHAIMYGAQARGYAEAMALAPLLVLAMEWLRRRPRSKWRAVLVVMVALQLSMTIYSAWVYWAFPILVISALVLPKYATSKDDAQKLKSVMLIITFCVIGLMCIYTMSRWRSLSFTASHMGVPIQSFQNFLGFMASVLSHLFGQGYLLYIPLIVWGTASYRKSHEAWWLQGLVASAALMLMLMLLNGSAGYPRNFGLWIVLLAVLAGVGADRLMATAQRAVHVNIVSIGTPVLLAMVSITAFPWASAQAHDEILPDWGGMVQRIDKEPETNGPRWFARCMANHWQIDWYQPHASIDRILAVPTGETFELVTGFQYDNKYQEISYQEDIMQSAILPSPVPSYLASVPATDIRGIPIRRWVGVKEELLSLGGRDSETPVFLAISIDSQAMSHVMLRIETLGQSVLREVVFFAQSHAENQTVMTLIAPRYLVARIAQLLHADASKLLTIHAYVLSPIEKIES